MVKEAKLLAEDRSAFPRRLTLQPNEKPKIWEHVFEFVTPVRSYRLFSNSYETKEQWVYALSEYVKYHREQVGLSIPEHSEEIDSDSQDHQIVIPANAQGCTPVAGGSEETWSEESVFSHQIKSRAYTSKALTRNLEHLRNSVNDDRPQSDLEESKSILGSRINRGTTPQ